MSLLLPSRSSISLAAAGLVAVVLAGTQLQAMATAYDYTAGHCDIGLGYTSGTGSGSGPRLYLQFGGDAVATGLSSSQLIAGEPGGIVGEWSTSSFVTVVPQSVSLLRPAGAEWDFLGTPAGQPVWVFGQNSQAGVPFLGFNTEKAGGGTGTFILASVLTRPTDGQVSLFQIGGFGTTTVYWSSAEPGVDELTVPAQTHAHYNFGFTKPGYYELHVSGTGSGFPGQATGVLAFQVVPEPSASIAAVLAGLLAWAFLRSRHRHLTGRARLWPAA